MDIWHYNQHTGELISKGTADPDQLTPGKWLYPAHSTTLKPPTIVDGYARVFRGDGWTLVEDHRGEVWWTAEGRPVEVTDLGDPRTAGLLSSEPNKPTPDPLPLPITVAASSAKLTLDDDGLYQQVEDICRNHPVSAVRIFWESANTWIEDNPYVQAIGVELGLSDEMVHAMFERALLK